MTKSGEAKEMMGAGGGGDDKVHGGAGDDKVHGGEGDDVTGGRRRWSLEAKAMTKSTAELATTKSMVRGRRCGDWR